MGSFTTVTGFAALLLFLSGCCNEVPVEHRLTDCTNSTLRFQMPVKEFPPYQFVMGMPQSPTGQLNFRGEIVLRQSTGIVARVQISSETITPCNWLNGLSGYILTWERTNRLESILKRGQTYDVEIQFSEPPPPESSVWLSAMKRVGL